LFDTIIFGKRGDREKNQTGQTRGESAADGSPPGRSYPTAEAVAPNSRAKTSWFSC